MKCSYHREMTHILVFVYIYIFISNACTLYATPLLSSLLKVTEDSNTRGPPSLDSHLLLSQKTFTDQSDHVKLGDEVGSTIALGDFTNDGYTDLVVCNNLEKTRSLRIFVWDHKRFIFDHNRQTAKSSDQTFSLDSVQYFAEDALIVSATPVDIDVDGNLDLVISVQVSTTQFFGVVLRGDGFGNLQYCSILPSLTPSFLVFDANDDNRPDIFFISSESERVFYVNNPKGSLSKHVWKPRTNEDRCIPLTGKNSLAFTDLNGDCASDLIIPTICGLEVWLNRTPSLVKTRWINGRVYRKEQSNFLTMSLDEDETRILLLNSSVWSHQSGDETAIFADFNGDGTIDIGVPNSEKETFRISYNVRTPYPRGKLCVPYPEWTLQTNVVLEDLPISKAMLGSIAVEQSVRVGDFNYDGKLDLLIVDAASGNVNLFVAQSDDSQSLSLSGSSRTSAIVDQILFPITGGSHLSKQKVLERLRYVRVAENSLFQSIEDPVAATFIDIDETGRQDVLITQKHGTRLIWNSYKNFPDAVYFKVSTIGATVKRGKQFIIESQRRSILQGNVVKIAYGGRYGRVTQVCVQCAQGGVLTLQSCSCLFGISRIANYIDEMAVGWNGGARTWYGLMPNVLAVVLQQLQGSNRTVKWKMSYTARGHDGQMRRVVLMLFTTLIVLIVAIVYIEAGERKEQRQNKLHV